MNQVSGQFLKKCTWVHTDLQSRKPQKKRCSARCTKRTRRLFSRLLINHLHANSVGYIVKWTWWGRGVYREMQLEQVLSLSGEGVPCTVRSKLNKFVHVWGDGVGSRPVWRRSPLWTDRQTWLKTISSPLIMVSFTWLEKSHITNENKLLKHLEVPHLPFLDLML